MIEKSKGRLFRLKRSVYFYFPELRDYKFINSNCKNYFICLESEVCEKSKAEKYTFLSDEGIAILLHCPAIDDYFEEIKSEA